MITPRNENTFLYAGLSTDQKPTKYVGNGSMFIEMDTSKTYIYIESTKTWTLFDLGSGGGGGGEYVAGENITIENNVISAVDTKYTAGNNITISDENVISAEANLADQLVASLNVGGVEKGDTFAAGTPIEDIIKAILTEISPVEGTIYYGALDTESPSVQDLNSTSIPAEIKVEGITLDLRTTGKQFQCIVYPKELGLLVRIIQNGLSEFNVLDSFNRTEITVDSKDYYCYCTYQDALEPDQADYSFYWN